jgi:hypothetical protein
MSNIYKYIKNHNLIFKHDYNTKNEEYKYGELHGKINSRILKDKCTISYINSFIKDDILLFTDIIGFYIEYHLLISNKSINHIMLEKDINNIL